MNRIKKKLSSQSGASITYALLLFLVCAVVSSVVLAAGTAASGRISQSVESDQRYYSVTSAANLLKEMIENVEVKVETKTVTDSSGQQTVPTEYPKINNTRFDSSASQTFLTEATAYYTGLLSASNMIERDISLKVNDTPNLNVLIHEKLDPENGKMSFLVSNASTSTEDAFSVAGSGGLYSVLLIFDPVVVRNKPSTKTQGYGTNRTRTESRETVLKWVLSSMG